MYYSISCPKCGTQLSEFEDDTQASWDANPRLQELLKAHYLQMHQEEQQLQTDEELKYSIQTGMKTSDEKPY